MSGFRTGIALVIVVIIVLLGVFYSDLKGYEEIDRVNEWVLYYCEECDLEETEVSGYILMNGFTEMTVTDALEDEYFSDEIEEDILAIIMEHEEQ